MAMIKKWQIKAPKRNKQSPAEMFYAFVAYRRQPINTFLSPYRFLTEPRKILMPESVFVRPETLETTSGTTVRRLFNQALEKTEMRRVHSHDLGNTFSALLIQQKANPKYIQEQLGHGRIESTMKIYGHLFEGDDRRFVHCLDDPQMPQPTTQTQPALEVIHTVSL